MCLNFVTSEPYEIFLTLKVFQTTVYDFKILKITHLNSPLFSIFCPVDPPTQSTIYICMHVHTLTLTQIVHTLAHRQYLVIAFFLTRSDNLHIYQIVMQGSHEIL